MWLHCVGYYNCYRTDLNIFILDNRSLPIYFVLRFNVFPPGNDSVPHKLIHTFQTENNYDGAPDGVIHVRISVQVFNSCYL